MTKGEQEVYDFIKEMFEVFGNCEFIAKGNLNVTVKTKGYIHKLYTEIIPHVKPKQVEKVKKK